MLSDILGKLAVGSFYGAPEVGSATADMAFELPSFLIGLAARFLDTLGS